MTSARDRLDEAQGRCLGGTMTLTEMTHALSIVTTAPLAELVAEDRVRALHAGVRGDLETPDGRA